jgi:hypothetical protein
VNAYKSDPYSIGILALAVAIHAIDESKKYIDTPLIKLFNLNKEPQREGILINRMNCSKAFQLLILHLIEYDFRHRLSSYELNLIMKKVEHSTNFKDMHNYIQEAKKKTFEMKNQADNEE